MHDYVLEIANKAGYYYRQSRLRRLSADNLRGTNYVINKRKAERLREHGRHLVSLYRRDNK